MKRGIKVDGEFLNHLRFADDIVLISQGPNELQTMLELSVKSKFTIMGPSKENEIQRRISLA